MNRAPNPLRDCLLSCARSRRNRSQIVRVEPNPDDSAFRFSSRKFGASYSCAMAALAASTREFWCYTYSAMKCAVFALLLMAPVSFQSFMQSKPTGAPEKGITKGKSSAGTEHGSKAQQAEQPAKDKAPLADQQETLGHKSSEIGRASCRERVYILV